MNEVNAMISDDLGIHLVINCSLGVIFCSGSKKLFSMSIIIIRYYIK